MSKPYIIPPKTKRHYNRFRSMPLASDTASSIEVLTTRYSSGIGKRPAKGPRGGKAYQEFHRMTYFDQTSGLFFRASKVATAYEGGQPCQWIDALSPITGNITDCHTAQSEEENIPPVTIICQYGKPIRVSILGTEEVIWQEGDTPESLAFFLGLDKKKRKSPKTSA